MHIGVIIQVGVALFLIFAAIILYIQSENKKIKFYASIFIVALLLLFSFASIGHDTRETSQFFRVLALAVPLYLYLHKDEISKRIKYIVYGIIGISLFVAFWESFSCSNFDAMPLCGLFTILIIMPILFFLDFIALSHYLAKLIKKHS